MPLPRRHVSLAQAFRVLIAALPLAACSSPTDVDPLSVSLRTIAFATQEELEQWPSSPVVQGGERLIVRGRAFVGCGRPEAEVRRWGSVVGLQVKAVDTDRICLGIMATWVAVEATVSVHEPGAYLVREGLEGLSDRPEGTATIGRR